MRLRAACRTTLAAVPPLPERKRGRILRMLEAGAGIEPACAALQAAA